VEAASRPGQFTTIPDGATIAGNDLIIVTRETSSSNYSNDTGEALAWNQFNIPIINMAPHIMRESRWGWESGEGLPTVANITSFNAFPDIGHPFFENLSAPETEAFTAANTIRSVDGDLPPSTSVLATYGSNNLFGIFIIPEGSPMFGGLGAAGADRVGFLRGEDNSWNDANSNTETILRNMISFYDPALAGDSDSDGLDDNFEEAIINADPNDALITIADVLPGDDFDNDNLTNQEEHDLSPRTDPTDSDSDGDTLSDGEEVSGELNPFDATGNNVGIPKTNLQVEPTSIIPTPMETASMTATSMIIVPSQMVALILSWTMPSSTLIPMAQTTLKNFRV